MSLTIGEKIKLIASRKNMPLGAIADGMGQTRQNFSNKIKRDNFTEKETLEIAKILGCSFEPVFTIWETGEKI